VVSAMTLQSDSIWVRTRGLKNPATGLGTYLNTQNVAFGSKCEKLSMSRFGPLSSTKRTPGSCRQVAVRVFSEPSKKPGKDEWRVSPRARTLSECLAQTLVNAVSRLGNTTPGELPHCADLILIARPHWHQEKHATMY
jgi:hypothetical protein